MSKKYISTSIKNLHSILLALVFLLVSVGLLQAQENTEQKVEEKVAQISETKVDRVIEKLPELATERSKVIGLGLSLWQTPEESDFASDGNPIELFFDWDINDELLKVRFGYISYKSKMDFEKYNKTVTNKMETTNIYVAYRYSMNLNNDLNLFALAGLASISSKYSAEMSSNSKSSSASGFGLITGIGAFYYLGKFGIGGQFEIFSGSGDFGGVSLATGSNQLSVMAGYAF